MILRKAERKQARIRVLLQGPSGAGKTFSALLMAYGLTSDWSTVAIIDTENHAADLYAHLGDYQVLTLEPPFTPERYIEALATCELAGAKAVILDSLSAEWTFILDAHGATTGNSYTNWSKFTPRHEALIQALLQSSCHVLATVRAKQDYVLTEKNGKQVPEKVGMKGITRDGLDYEFTLVFELDGRHQARATKDRTGLFSSQPEGVLTAETGQQILHWCNTGTSQGQVMELIQQTHDVQGLRDLYAAYPEFRQALGPLFTQRKEQLQLITQSQTPTNQHGNPTSIA